MNARSRTEDDWELGSVAVLVSGGLDSAILMADLAKGAERVHPLYVRFGLYWEKAEEQSLRRFLSALDAPAVAPLTIFEMPILQVYGEHWSTNGSNVPAADSADEAVFLPGRNLLLLAQSGIWCQGHGIPSLALATLAGNPFSDAMGPFFESMETSIRLALGSSPRIRTPYANRSKQEVMLRGAGLPLELTFSCIHPIDGRHCGECNKCAERKKAFREAGIKDETVYGQSRDSLLEERSCTE